MTEQPASPAEPVRTRSGSAAVFELSGVAVTFPTAAGRLTVLNELDVVVREGEVLTIVGGSGTGKSTLLRLLGGLAAPTGGSVFHRGQRVRGVPEGVVTVFQDYASSLLPWRTTRQNVALGLASRRGMPRADREARVEELLALVGLSAAADKYPWQLSGGMQQRAQIARALVTDPDVLLMDEPFGALDAITRGGLQDAVARIQAARGGTIVFITHDVEEAIYLGDRVLVLGGSPAGITAEVDVDLPRPRSQVETRGSARFIDLRARVHAALQPGSA